MKVLLIIGALVVLAICIGWFVMMLWPRAYMKENPLTTFLWYATILGGLGGAFLLYANSD